jgi:hypothetical protein
MNLLANTRVYLAGAVEHDKSAKSWRELLTEKLEKFHVVVYDPLVKPAWLPADCKADPSIYRPVLAGKADELHTTLTPERVYKANEAIRKLCLAHVASADWIICYMPIKFTAGTFEEIYLAHQLNKPIFFMIPDGIPSTWMLPMFTSPADQKETFFDNWDLMFEHINNIDKDKVELDPYKWVSIEYPRGVEISKQSMERVKKVMAQRGLKLKE